MKNEKTEKTELDYAKETAHYTRRISENLQFFFWVFVLSGAIGIMLKVISAVNQLQ